MTNEARSLVERRRDQTRVEIHLAALTLFEQQGVDATTVAEIAAEAGISSRTFFRYFDNKEHAGIPGQESLRKRITAFVPSEGSPNSLLQQIEAVFEEEILTAAERNDDSRRVARLFAAEPALLEAAAAQLQRVSKALQAVLLEHCPSLRRSTTLLITDLAITTWHTSWETLGERIRAGQDITPIENYREHCRMLREITR
ncbi:MAG: TetR family transcriptional regulator [Gulosibacter sp.]|uniref:TetR/AcrR family transcriptional regulator n=1 Tax=Gulosibacter sp. TaxID=2817531 RepID=UPI003F8FB67A